MKTEIKVGIIVIFALSSLFVSMFFIKDVTLFEEKGLEYIVRFRFLNNLMLDGSVKLYGGINIGAIKKFSQDGEKARIHIIITDMNVNKLLQSQKVIFSIRGASMLGEKYVLLEFDSKKGKHLVFKRDKSGKLLEAPVIDGTESAGLEEIIDKADDLVQKEVKTFLVRMNKILQKKEIDGIIDNLHSASKNLNSLMDNSNKLVRDLSRNKVGETFTEVNKTLRNTNREIVSISKDIRRLVQTTNQGMKNLFNRKDGVGAVTRESLSVLKSVNKLIHSIRKIVKNMEDKSTPVGTLLSDEQVAREIRQVIKNLSQLTNDLKENPLVNKKKQYRPGPY